MDNLSVSDDNAIARFGLLSLHEAVRLREADCPEKSLSPSGLLELFRAADPTRNAACLPWLLRTYTFGGYRLEDLTEVCNVLKTFMRLRGRLPDTASIDGETRNPRKLGSHMTLESLWLAVAPLVEQERLAKQTSPNEQDDVEKKCALAESRVLLRSERMIIVVPMTKEASCWWGRGTQWCTAAGSNNFFNEYHRIAPLIIICLRKNGDLPARKMQMYIHHYGIQFTDENDISILPDIILERWQDLAGLFHWAVTQYGFTLRSIPENYRTEALCIAAVMQNGQALQFVPYHLRTEETCLAAVTQAGHALEFTPEYLRGYALCAAAVNQNGYALQFVPEHLRTEALCLAAVTQNGMMLRYIPKRYRTEAACLAAVKQDGHVLGYISKHLRTEVLCTAAVTQNGQVLRTIPLNLRTEALCLAAVVQNGMMLRYIPKHLRTKAICMAASAHSTQELVSVSVNPDAAIRHEIKLDGLESLIKTTRNNHHG